MKTFISLNIKYLYEENNLNQNDFGELFGLKKGVISTYVQGKTNPSIETIQKICNHFNLSLDDFINKDLRRVKKVEYGNYNTDPLIGLMAQEPPGSMQAAGYVNMIGELRGRLKDKDEVISEKNKRITMLEDEIRRLKGGEEKYKNQTG